MVFIFLPHLYNTLLKNNIILISLIFTNIWYNVVEEWYDIDDILSFDTGQLTEILDELNSHYYEYSSSLSDLDKEISNLENIWGVTDKSIYNDFKEVYKEKKQKLVELESLINFLITYLSSKNDQLITATEKAKNSFE